MKEKQKLLAEVLEGAEMTLPTLHPSRARSIRERVYLELWRHENKQRAGINGGAGLLELLLIPEGSNERVIVSKRDAEVATTIIQWLGTNCGSAFVYEAQRRVKAEQETQTNYGTNGFLHTEEGWGIEKVNGEAFVVATQIAQNFLSVETSPDSVRYLARAILEAIISFAGEKPQPLPIITSGRRHIELERQVDSRFDGCFDEARD